MKRLFILFTIMSLTLITMMNCSDNSSITSSEPTEEPDDQPAEDTEGGVAFTFTKSNAKAQGMVAYASPSDDFPDPTNVRILIRRYDGNNLTFNTLGDVTVPTDTTLVLTVPAANDYQIDAFSYVDSTATYKYLLKYDQVQNIQVQADSVTQVSLVLEPIMPNFVIPDSIDRGDKFVVGVETDQFGVAPELQFLSFVMSDTLFNDDLVRDFDSGKRQNQNYFDAQYTVAWEISESEIEDKYVYLNTQFIFSRDEYLRSDESNYIFRYNYPNPYIEDDTLKTFIKVPEGGIGVTVEY